MVDFIINEIDSNSKEGKELIKSIDKEISESKSYIDKWGGKSYEGFVRTSKGPKGISDDD